MTADLVARLEEMAWWRESDARMAATKGGYEARRNEAAILREAASALRSSGEAASAWRPIAEAPLNESLLLLGWNNGNPANGAHIVIGSNWHGRWVDRGMDEANRDLGNTLAYIEYFQALPTPPTSTKGG